MEDEKRHSGKIFEERVVSRDLFDEDMLHLFSFIYSDEYLARDFVFEQLKNWSNDLDYIMVFMAENSLDLTSFINSVCSSLRGDLFDTMKRIEEKETVITRVCCSICRNFGSIISSRTTASSIKFLCEICESLSPYGSQVISNLNWSRRCNEASNYQWSSRHTQIISPIQNELSRSIENSVFEVIPSIMIVKKDNFSKIFTLKALFCMGNFRKAGYGRKLINFIPTLEDSYSISICTAGLESLFLFSKCIDYLITILTYLFILSFTYIFILEYYSKFASPRLYLRFGDMIEQDEFNASAFVTNQGLQPISDENKSIIEVLHMVNTIYFYSLARYLMNYLAGIYYFIYF